MATVSGSALRKTVPYPTSDGKPMAETDWHRILMIDLIQTLEGWFADDPKVYVSGNLLMFYVEGDRRRHLSPDVFVVKGVPKHERLYYLLWEEKKGPDVVIECGVAHGGAMMLYASILDLLGKGHVLGIDVEIRKYNRLAR